MASLSILYPETDDDIKREFTKDPFYFKDLNLDQIIQAITGKQEYLKPYFYTPLHNAEVIKYRHEIMYELECKTIFNRIKSFSENINSAATSVNLICERLFQKEKYYCNYIEKGRLLEAAKIYCEGIKDFINDLSTLDLQSHGLLKFQEYISNYSKSDHFISLMSETNALKSDLTTVQYCMLIKGNCIKVRKYEDEENYSTKIEEIFQKFKQDAVKDYRKKFHEEAYAEHVEAGVLDLVAKLYPEIITRMDEYSIKNKNFLDETIETFSREVQFYITYIEYMSKFRQVGLRFCYPEISSESKSEFNYEGFDLALANKLINQNLPIICNDYYLNGNERIIVVSGPNQGGKTTFARTFGQLHHIASLGCPILGKEAKLFMFDQIFTHFEREEDLKTLNGKLQDELIRMHDILCHATSDSIIIINEILSSTTLQDAILIGKKIMEELIKLDSLCVCVTFIDEMASLSEKNVSMVSTVMPDDTVRRTYKIVRRPSDGLAYAMHIAEKYRVTYKYLKERIRE